MDEQYLELNPHEPAPAAAPDPDRIEQLPLARLLAEVVTSHAALRKAERVFKELIRRMDGDTELPPLESTLRDGVIIGDAVVFYEAGEIRVLRPHRLDPEPESREAP